MTPGPVEVANLGGFEAKALRSVKNSKTLMLKAWRVPSMNLADSDVRAVVEYHENGSFCHHLRV